MKTTYAQFQASPIPGNLGYCPTDKHLLQLLNKARQRMLNHGKWFGTVCRASFKADNGCVAFPEAVADFERIAIHGRPIPIHNGWYDFVENLGRVPMCGRCHNHGGHGRCGRCSCLSSTDMGTSPLFTQFQGDKFIKLYPSHPSDVGKRVLIQGYDQNHIPIRNQDGLGNWYSGEYLTLALPFVVSVAQYSSVTAVQKDVTNERVLAYELDPVTTLEQPIAIWGPTNVSPSFRRLSIPWIRRGSCSNGQPCHTTVDAIVKLDYAPVADPTDWLVIDNLVALEHACRGEQYFEQDRPQEAATEIAVALAELNHELRTHTGDRQSFFVDVCGRSFTNDLASMR